MPLKGQEEASLTLSLIIFVIILVALIITIGLIGVTADAVIKTSGKLLAVGSSHSIEHCLLGNENTPVLWDEIEEKINSCKVSDVSIDIKDMETDKAWSKKTSTSIGNKDAYYHHIWLPVRVLENGKEKIHTARMEVIKYVK